MKKENQILKDLLNEEIIKNWILRKKLQLLNCLFVFCFVAILCLFCVIYVLWPVGAEAPSTILLNALHDSFTFAFEKRKGSQLTVSDDANSSSVSDIADSFSVSDTANSSSVSDTANSSSVSNTANSSSVSDAANSSSVSDAANSSSVSDAANSSSVSDAANSSSDSDIANSSSVSEAANSSSVSEPSISQPSLPPVVQLPHKKSKHVKELSHSIRYGHGDGFWVVLFYSRKSRYYEEFNTHFVNTAESMAEISHLHFRQLNCDVHWSECTHREVPHIQMYFGGQDHGFDFHTLKDLGLLESWINENMADDGAKFKVGVRYL